MPQIEEVMQTLEEIANIHKKKNDDYATMVDPFFNFKVQEYILNLFDNPRDKVYASLIALKLARLAVQLNAEYRNPEHKPNNEGILDTMLDMPTYQILWRADYMRRNVK